MLYNESDTAAYGGQFAKARELTRRASDSAQRADKKETAAGYEAEAAVREALVGNMSQAKQQAQAALALSNGRDVEALSAIALGLAGDAAQATRLADDLAKRYPEDTIVQFELPADDPRGAALSGGRRHQGNRSTCPGCSLRTRDCYQTLHLLSTPFTCVAKLMWPRIKAAPLPPSSRKFSTTPASW